MRNIVSTLRRTLGAGPVFYDGKRTCWPGLAIVAITAIGLLAGSGAAAECPRNYEMEQKATLDADFVRFTRELAQWRDMQFKYALDQYSADYRTGSKRIYDRLELDRTRLRDRIVGGDLKDSPQRERSEAARMIGGRFRADIAALKAELRGQYNAQIARTRHEVADMRHALQDEYSQERRALQETIASGCRALRVSRLRSIFLWVGERVNDGASPDETTPIYGNLGIRG